MNVDSISLKFLLESLQSSACKALLQQFLWDKAILEVEVEEYFVVMCFILATLMQLFVSLTPFGQFKDNPIGAASLFTSPFETTEMSANVNVLGLIIGSNQGILWSVFEHSRKTKG